MTGVLEGKTQEALDTVLEHRGGLRAGRVPPALLKSLRDVVLGVDKQGQDRPDPEWFKAETGPFKSMVVRALCKAQGGPFIGPRGGKWANAQHTVPWKPSGGVLRVDAALVRETVDGWFSDLRAMPGQSRSSMIEYTQADGAKRRAVAQIVVEASTGDPRGVKGIHHYRTTGQGGMHKVCPTGSGKG